MKKLTLSLIVATALWFIMFSPWTAPLVDFWCAMAVSAVVLISLACLFGGRPQLRLDVRELLIGVELLRYQKGRGCGDTRLRGKGRKQCLQCPVAKTTVGWPVEAGVTWRSSLDRRQEEGA